MRWWENKKDILVREKKRLDAFFIDNDFIYEVIEDNLWLKGTILIEGISSFKFQFECEYPKSYPFAPPKIYPKDKSVGWVPGHQFTLNGRFCLDIREYNWSSSMTAVEIIESMRVLILASFDKYLTKGKKLGVEEGVEPTQLELKTKEVKCVYDLNSTSFISENKHFEYFEFADINDGRVIIPPEIIGESGDERLKSIMDSNFFKIWGFNILINKKKGIQLTLNQSLIEEIVFCEKLVDFQLFLENKDVITKSDLEDIISEEKCTYVLLLNEDLSPTLFVNFNLEKGSINYYGCYGVDFGKLQNRLPKRHKAHLVSEKKVTIFGCGSGGSSIAENLIKSGVETLTIIDYDILETENVIRHNCTFQDIGLKKTIALKKRLLSINPKSNIFILDEKIESISEKLDQEISGSDLIINALGYSSNLVNSYSYSKKIPTIHCKVYPWGFGGEVMRIIPNIHPCFECMNVQLNHILDKVDKNSDFPIDQTIDYNVGIDGELTSVPSLAVDANFIINIASKLAIETLICGEDELKDKISIILWGNRREWIFKEDFSCVKVDNSDFKSINNCIVCFDKDVITRELLMSNDEIKKEYEAIIDKM